MEKFDYYDENTNLIFHKLNIKENSAEQSPQDNSIVSILNSWKSSSITDYLLCGCKTTGLGNFFSYLVLDNENVDSYLYGISDGTSQEVIGATLLVPNYRITHRDLLIHAHKLKKIEEKHPEILKNFTQDFPTTDMDSLSLEKLIDITARGLLISALCIDPEITSSRERRKLAYGSRAIASILNNPSHFNDGIQPLCIMGNVDQSNFRSSSMLERNGFIPVHNPNGFDSYFNFNPDFETNN